MGSARRAVRGALGEWPLGFVPATTAGFLAFGRHLRADLDHPLRFAPVLAWPLITMLAAVFAVARHPELLAARLGEPLGTLVLTPSPQR